jgi:nucleoside 2-deoxyribosyltransferase
MTVALCPVCRGMNEGSCRELPSDFDGGSFDCDMCGSFKVTRTALAQLTNFEALSPIQRAALAHLIRSNQDLGSERPFIDSDWLKRFLESARLPTPGEQADNIIRFIGDQISKTGRQIETLPAHLWSSVGSPNPAFAAHLLEELMQKELLSGMGRKILSAPFSILYANLSLAGWERYEAQKRGKLAGNYGFVALKFGDSTLDPFVRDVVKPSIKAELGFDVIDMRDVSRAGVIDNIMRAQIRDAAFVLVDLTHDNFGAYWEAGYAEGLGKPVIYLCEQAKFDGAKTHFDTNHCTTVVWSIDEHTDFVKQLIATLRRSLNLFPKP